MIELSAEVCVHAPMRRCFDLTRSVDFHAHSSARIDGRAVAGRRAGLSELGDETTWSARFFGLRFRLTTRVTALDPPVAFDELLVRGRMRTFGHRYRLRAGDEPDSVVLRDEFFFASPLGVGSLGRRLDAALLEGRMREVQLARLHAIAAAAESDEWRAFVPA